jgi:hypothetical protein
VIVVMQCAARKQPDAGHMLTQDGRRVCFVADPTSAPASDFLYARPDDISDVGPSWRELLCKYNKLSEGNPLRLLQSYSLYRDSAYARLSERVGVNKFYILSAGWGLVSGSYLLPNYDITFSTQADPYKRRRKHELYQDFCMLPESKEPILFFGSNQYAELFCRLTAHIEAPKALFSRSRSAPELQGVKVINFETPRRTNWQYDCVNAFLSGKLELPFL